MYREKESALSFGNTRNCQICSSLKGPITFANVASSHNKKHVKMTIQEAGALKQKFFFFTKAHNVPKEQCINSKFNSIRIRHTSKHTFYISVDIYPGAFSTLSLIIITNISKWSRAQFSFYLFWLLLLAGSQPLALSASPKKYIIDDLNQHGAREWPWQVEYTINIQQCVVFCSSKIVAIRNDRLTSILAIFRNWATLLFQCCRSPPLCP